jgi:hypothetical protein
MTSRIATAALRLPAAGIALAAVAITVAASYVVLAADHADDRYRVDFVSGTWLGLADYARRGIVSPPLHDGQFYAGTRYMPLPVLLDGGLARLTGDLLVSAKVATYVIAVGLFAIAFVILRLRRCPTLLALGLLAAVVVTPTGLVGALGLRNDGLAVLFQLAAVAVVLRERSPAAVSAAGVLSALGILSKVSAVWAPVAIVVWLAMHERARLTRFLAALGASLGFALLVLELVSSGRFLSNAAAYTFAGRRGPLAPLTEGVQALTTNFVASGDAVWLLFPLAVAAIVVTLRERDVTLLQLALLVDVVVLAVVMSSRGTDHNHLLDLGVLTVLVVGELAGTSARDRLVAVLATAAVVWGVGTSYLRMMGPETVGSVRRLAHGESETNRNLDPNPLAGLVLPTDRILSEDPSIPLLLDQRPILLDSFIARYGFRDHPEDARELAARIERKEFDKIITVAGLEPGSPLFAQQFLGPIVNQAVAENYKLVHAQLDLYVYERVTSAAS